jgi:hypothetical protein
MASQQKFIVITAGGAYAWIIINALASRFDERRGGARTAGIQKPFPQTPGPQDRLGPNRRPVSGTMVMSRFGKRFVRARGPAEIMPLTSLSQAGPAAGAAGHTRFLRQWRAIVST